MGRTKKNSTQVDKNNVTQDVVQEFINSTKEDIVKEEVVNKEDNIIEKDVISEIVDNSNTDNCEEKEKTESVISDNVVDDEVVYDKNDNVSPKGEDSEDNNQNEQEQDLSPVKNEDSTKETQKKQIIKRTSTAKEMFGCDWLGVNYDF